MHENTGDIFEVNSYNAVPRFCRLKNEDIKKLIRLSHYNKTWLFVIRVSATKKITPEISKVICITHRPKDRNLRCVITIANIVWNFAKGANLKTIFNNNIPAFSQTFCWIPPAINAWFFQSPPPCLGQTAVPPECSSNAPSSYGRWNLSPCSSLSVFALTWCDSAKK